MKSEQCDMCEKACFIVPPKSAFWHMSHSLRLMETSNRCSRRLRRKPVTPAVWLLPRICFFLSFKEKYESIRAPPHAIAWSGSRRRVLRGQYSPYRCSRRLWRKPVTPAVWLLPRICFFLSFKEKYESIRAPPHAIWRRGCTKESGRRLAIEKLPNSVWF